MWVTSDGTRTIRLLTLLEHLLLLLNTGTHRRILCEARCAGDEIVALRGLHVRHGLTDSVLFIEQVFARDAELARFHRLNR